MGTCVTLWGIAAILQGAAYNWSGMMAARFFIGLSEAGYGTGVALYLSFFYPRQEIGARFAGFVVGSAIASAIAGSVAYGLQSAKTSVESWRLICKLMAQTVAFRSHFLLQSLSKLHLPVCR